MVLDIFAIHKGTNVRCDYTADMK